MSANYTLRYETSEGGIKQQAFTSWPAAKSAGEALNFDAIVPNVEISRLTPAASEYESGIFDDYGNRFAVIFRSEVSA